MHQHKARFERHFDKVPGCWEWKSAGGKGYGKFTIEQTTCLAHRVSYQLYVGPIPPKALVRHSCDNPRRVNPEHLLLGTDQSNADDRKQRQRSALGEKSKTNKLTPDQVRLIREGLVQGQLGKDLAKQFGVSPQCISDIKRGQRWEHL